MSDQFATKYRPTAFEEVIGHEAQVKALKAAIDKRRANVFLLSGPSGLGKTTLARIACAYANISPADIVEVDAASNTGVDDMRKIAEVVRYRGMSGGGRAAIIDECHRLSGNAWDSLLKATEEPRPGHYWFFCSTSPSKIPKTMQTRGVKIALKPLTEKQLDRLVMDVVKSEDLPIHDDAIDVVLEKADGSPRQALTNLAVCAEAASRKEAAELLEGSSESKGVINLCRFVLNPGSISELEKILADCAGESAEGIRIQIMMYLNAVAKNAKSEKQYINMILLMNSFRTPYLSNTEGHALLRISLADAIFNLGLFK